MSRYSYGLDCRGSVPGRGQIFLFSTESRVRDPTNLLSNRYWGLVPRGKAAGA
jgi:hypothetical protein